VRAAFTGFKTEIFQELFSVDIIFFLKGDYLNVFFTLELRGCKLLEKTVFNIAFT